MNWTMAGALWGLLGVGLGAFGAHGLKAVATDQGLAWWETAARYQLFHALALVDEQLFDAALDRAADRAVLHRLDRADEGASHGKLALDDWRQLDSGGWHLAPPAGQRRAWPGPPRPRPGEWRAPRRSSW